MIEAAKQATLISRVARMRQRAGMTPDDLRRPMINAHLPSLGRECYFQPAKQGAPDDEQRT